MQANNCGKPNKRGRPRSGESAKSVLGKKLKSLQGEQKNCDFLASLGVSNTTYASYLSGKTVPDTRALVSLHLATRVDLNWLLNDADRTPESGWPVLVEPEREKKESDLVQELREMVGGLEERVQELERDKDDLREHCELLRKEVAAEKKAAMERFGA